MVLYNLWPIAFLEVPLRLKSLELAGFKSFARPTVLEFPSGITALVGPNGSGKSNIVDAVRWCLGEQNSRDLRGHKAEDVIHAGRQRVLGSADVALTFQTGPGEDREWAELSVARRLYRSGESEYLINRGRQRLRDVQSLLRSVDIDNPRFIVVNQGMADFLLSATPAERRALLEQAAGLSGYRQRRDEAAQKLTATEQNLATAEIVLAELEPRVRLLRRQARAVEERGELDERLRTRLTEWYSWRWDDVCKRIASQAIEADTAGTERARVAAETDQLEESAEGVLQRERTWRTELDAATEALHLTERERDALRHEIERLGERDRSLTDARERSRKRAREVTAELEAHAERLAGVEGRLASLRSTTETLQRERGEAHADLAAAEANLTAEQQSSAALERESRRILARERELQRESQRLVLEVQHAERRSHELTIRLAALEASQRALEAQLETARTTLDAARQAEDCEVIDLARREDAERAVARRITRLQVIVSRLSMRRSALVRAVSDAQSARQRLGRDMGETVVASLQVSPGWEEAAASALGEWALLHPSALASIDGAGLERFVAWRDSLLAQSGVRGTWADREMRSSSAPAILRSTLLVDDDTEVDDAWQRLSQHPALLVGSPPVQVVSRSGVMRCATGRAHGERDDRPGRFLALKREEEDLAGRLPVIEEREQRARTALGDAQAEARAVAESSAAAQRAVRESRRRKAQVSADVEQLERRLEHIASDRQAGEREAGELLARTERARALLSDANAQLSSLDQERSGLERAAEAQARALEVHAHEVESMRARLRSVDQASHEAAATLNAEQQTALMLQREQRRLAEERERLDAEERSIMLEIESVSRAVSVATTGLSDLDAVHAEQAARVEQIRASRPEDPDTRDALRHARAGLSAVVGRHERARARLEELGSERTRLSQEITQELEVTVSSLPAPPGDPPAEDEIRLLRARAAQYADLDAAVVLEYREISERQAHLSAQIDDLRAAAEGLREIMTIADAEMRTRFRAALEDVTEQLGQVFRVMLRGGEARLEQVDADGGIEVRASLLGKRIRSSAAFSGGERALVATSLLFAVLRTRPTPFCVLDEVDAALDETNVDRYLAALREISERTQVIVVTHNRATMAAANALYGLTLDGDGASSVLSVRLDQYEAAG